MNKKVLTLCAGFMLAGGMLSTANAVDIKGIAGNGKYYKMVRASQYRTDFSSGWTSADMTTGNSAMFLIQEKEGDAYASSTIPEDKRALYWKVETKTLPGTTTNVYTFTNQLGETLTYTDAAGEKQTEFYSNIVASGTSWDGNTIRVDGVNGSLHINMSYTAQEDENPINWAVANDAEYSLAFDFVEIEEEAISVKDLNAELQNGFQIQIGKSGKKDYEEFENWAVTEKGFGNVFAGKLTAVDATDEKSTNTGTKEFYLKSGDKYIVLTDALWGGTNSDLNGKDHYKGYQFELVSAHTFASVNKANATFKIEKTYDFDQAYGDSLIVSMPDAQVGKMVTDNYTGGVRLFVADVNGKSYLTIIENSVADDRLTEDDAKELPYVRFGASNIVDFKDFAGKVWNITMGSKSLSPDAKSTGELDNFLSEFDPEGEVMLNAPEGEWLPYFENDQNYGFVNRESGAKWSLAKTYNEEEYNYSWIIRKVGENAYRVWSSKYDVDVNKPEQLKYTISITEAASKVGKQADGNYKSFTEAGYARYEDAVKELEGKYITLKNGVTGATMYVGKNADDEVILTEDQTEAIEFRVKELKHDYTAHNGYNAVDTLRHYTTYYGYKPDGTLSASVQDTVQFQHFRLFEHFSEKALVYAAGKNSEHKFVLSEIESTDNAHEDFNVVIKGDDNINDIFSTFVLKKKADGNYNLVSYYNIQYPSCTENHTNVNGNFDNFIETNLNESYNSAWFGSSMKMEGNVGKATVDNTANIYTHTNEDRFALVDIETPEYMTITGSQDTVKISLQAKPSFFLYEQGKNGTNFLGMEHVADVKDMKAAILADTAYVRNNTFKPQYLLAVDTDIKPEIPCEIDGHPTLHPDTVYGRFLINAVDSAKAWKGSVKTNPYIHEQLNGVPYYRLVFVDGYHTGDALTLNTAGGKTKIALNNNNDKVCTFAFRYVDVERKGVKIETTYDGKYRGWLKYQNNIPVVTKDYNDAHVFLVDNTTTETPTANENIAAGNVVVAGVDGAVVVKGAEGKNVIVSTILGKVVANEVVSSDNATIAAPAGIVVVSVDGESFKVVVK